MKIVLNHKCNFTKQEFLTYQKELERIKTDYELIICPSYVYIPLLDDHFTKGSQDVSVFSNGAHTGDISAKQLKSLGVEYTIVGHSERRTFYQEQDEVIKEKIKKLQQEGITPIVCVGETKEARKSGETFLELEKQLSILQDQTKAKIIIAYEPIWAIGTGVLPKLQEIDEVLFYIKKKFPNATLLYGGSVTDENINNIKESQYIDGYLLGGLSLNPSSLQNFLNLCR